MTVNIQAFATADHTKNVVAPLQITGFAGGLSGRYVFQVKGTSANSLGQPQFYQIAGAVNFDGNGGIALEQVNGQMIGGEETYSSTLGSGLAYITGGSYSVGPDGRGTLALTTNNAAIGVSGTQSFTLVSLSNSQAYLAEVDGTATGSGNMELQTSASAPTGGYAFVVNGSDANNQPIAFGGVMNIDSSTSISGAGSVTDANYLGALQNCPAPSGLSGTIGVPDHFGAVTFSLTPCFSAATLQITAYIVDAGHMSLIEDDLANGLQGGFATSGIAIGQGSATGHLGSPQVFSGAYVYGLLGSDSSLLPASLTMAGVIAPSSNGSFTGTMDEFAPTLSVSDSYSGPYTIDPTGTGRIDTTVNFESPANSGTSTPELIFYASSNAGPAAVLDSDLTSGASGIGVAYPQGSSLILSDSYGLSLTNLYNGLQFNMTGQFGAANTGNTISGLLDGSEGYLSPAGITAAPLSGTYQAPDASGRSSGTLEPIGEGNSGLNVAPVQVEFYLIDANHGFLIETDALGQVLGTFSSNNSVCSSCQ